MNTIFKKVATGTAVLALSTGVFAGATFAAGNTTEINGGARSLTGATTSEFTGVTLNGKIQTVTANINSFTIMDATGSGAGWDFNVSATLFNHSTEGDLSAGSLILDIPTITAIEEGSDEENTILFPSEPVSIDNALATPVAILSAEADGGMGTYTVGAIPMTLTLMPNEVYSGTYTSTITTTLTAGPGN